MNYLKKIFVATSWLVLLVTCDTQEAPTVYAAEYADLDSFSVNTQRDIAINMVGYVLEKNQLAMQYKAPLMFQHQRIDSPYIEFTQGLQIDMFDTKNGAKKSGYLESTYGMFKRKEGLMYFKDKVKVINGKGEILRSDDLWWNQDKKRITTDKRISILQAGAKIYGVGLDATDDMSEYEIRQLSGKIKGGDF